MKQLRTMVVAVPLSLACWAGTAYSATTVNETRNITTAVQKISLEGVINVTVRQGPTPSMVVYAREGRLAEIKTEVRGDTLYVDTDHHRGRFSFSLSDDEKHDRGEMRVEITMPILHELSTSGVGGSDVAGFTGDDLRVSLSGAGNVKISGQYKHLNARLSGVGALEVNTLNSDEVDVSLPGTGVVTLIGQAKNLKARMGGLGHLEAQKLRTQNADVNLSGLGGANIYASDCITLNLSGMGGATVYGNPKNRHISADGLGSVSYE